jgi:hypothetical protein
MNDANDRRYGAYMVYDNELNKILTDPSNSVSPADRMKEQNDWEWVYL